MRSQVSLLMVCLAGLTAAQPTSLSDKDGLSPVPAATVNEDQLKGSITLIQKFIQPFLEALNDDKGDPISRINKIVDASLLLGREAVKLREQTGSNQEVLEEVEAAREAMPLILDVLRASTSFFKKDSSFGGFSEIANAASDLKAKAQ